MASRENLIREVRVDKNGVPTARWVKPDTGRETSLNLPAPTTAPSREALVLSRIDRLDADLEQLQHDDSYMYNSLYSKLKRRSIKVAREAHNINLLETYADLFIINDVDPRLMNRCINVFRNVIGEETAGRITDEHVRHIDSYFRALERNERFSQVDKDERDALIDGCIELSLRTTGDAPRIVEILERGVRSLSEIEGMLNESRDAHGAVSGGFL